MGYASCGGGWKATVGQGSGSKNIAGWDGGTSGEHFHLLVEAGTGVTERIEAEGSVEDNLEEGDLVRGQPDGRGGQ